MNILNIYSTGLLFREADIDDPPDYSDYEHYQKKKIYSTSLLLREADIGDPPYNSIHEQYEHSKSFLFKKADINVPDVGWPSDPITSCASTLKSDIIEAWKRRKKKNHRKEAWKRCKKRRQLKLDRLKPVPHRLKPD
jgi:hypothetical protein